MFNKELLMVAKQGQRKVQLTIGDFALLCLPERFTVTTARIIWVH